MKKFNKNIIVFILAALFVGFGFSLNYVLSLGSRVAGFLRYDLKTEGFNAFHQLTADVDSLSSKNLRYHSELMDLDSLKHFFLNTGLIQKDDTTVVKAEGNTLITPVVQCSEEHINSSASAVKALQEVSVENGADFLYIAVPGKNAVFAAPENVDNHGADNLRRFTEALQQKDVPVLDIYKALEQENMLKTDTYFLTDHHWKPETGFWATEKICAALSDRYGFEYDTGYNDLENYNTKNYPDWFLGAYGKKVGRYFTPGGPEDITLITPKFETDLTALQPLKNEERTGTFEESVLDMGQINTKKHYVLSPYSTYGGGDFRLQIIKNNLNPEGKKILIVRDSFACAVTPFLSLHAGELHVVDVRNFIPSEPLDVHEYIREISPDYVLVLYNGVDDPNKMTDMFVFSN